MDGKTKSYSENETHLDNTIEQETSQYYEAALKQYELPEVRVSLVTVLGYATPLEMGIQLLGAIMAIASGAALPLMTILLGSFVNLFSGFTSPLTPSLTPPASSQAFRHEVTRLALDLFYIGLGVLVTTYIGTICWIFTGERISRRIREKYLQAVLRQNVAFFDKIGAGEITHRLTHDINLIQDGISDKISTALASIATIVSGFVIAFVRQWKFALILSSMFPTLLFIFGMGGGMTAKLVTKVVSEFSSAATIAQEVISSIRTAQAFGMDEKLAATYDSSLIKAQKVGYRKVIVSAGMFAAVFCLVYMTFGLAFWEGSRMIASNKLNVGLLMNVLFAILLASLSITLLLPLIENFSKATAASQNILQTIYRVPPIDSLSSEGEVLKTVIGNIEFQNVSFLYPSRPEVMVLKDLSLSIPSGKFTAIVGASGSGKSTIIQLIERFYDPVEGKITIDGHDIKNLNVRSLRSCMSLVSQEPVLFDTTIYENVCHGMVGTHLENSSPKEKRDMVEKACVLSNADQFIRSLPEGYDTVVGESGALLSGGQKQRIAIARAVVSDPKILLLDEATSALDTASERKVQEALDMASRTRTTVCIAHRLSTIRNADNIVVLSRGEVVEQGTHTELLTLGGVYEELVQHQLVLGDQQGYADEKREKGGRDVEEYGTINNLPLASVRSVESPASLEIGQAQPYTSEDDLTVYSNFQLIKKTLKWNSGEYGWVILGWLMSLPTGGVYPAQALLFAFLISDLLNPDIAAMRTRANQLSLWWLIISIILFLAYFVQGWAFGYASEKMVRRVRYRSFRSIMRQETAFFDRHEHSTGALTTMLSTEATAMSGLSGVNLGSILTVLVNLTSGTIVAIAFGWKLALVACSLIPVGVMAGYMRTHLLATLDMQMREAYEKSATLACDQVAAIRTIASLKREIALHKEFCQSLKAPMRKALRSTLGSAALYALGQSLAFFVNALLYWYGSTLLRSREYSLIQFIVVFVAMTEGAQGAGHFFSFAPDITKARSSTVNVTRLMERRPQIDSWSTEGTPVSELGQGQLSFKNVHFQYPTRPHVPVLRGLDLEVKPGQYVALVGPSGCGKSTAVALVERFYDPTVGSVLVDGIPTSLYNLSELRKILGLVSQEPTLYYGTIRFNIVLGATREVTEEEIDRACRDANIFEFIQSLPQGYETVVGTKGSALSGGQKQRIALARALIRNPKILLLDEATSSLDSESEKIVQAALDKAAKGRTTLAIAHRLSTIQNADMIYVIEKGRVVECGTHTELVALGGKYFELARQQKLEKRQIKWRKDTSAF